jgi:hypothetical protein
LVYLAGVLIVGVLCACMVALPRLAAEYFWVQAKLKEARCDYSDSRASLQTALWLFGELGDLERTWLLQGKLDYSEGRSSPSARFFFAYQYGRGKFLREATSHLEDIPWQIQLTNSPEERRWSLALMEDVLAGPDGQRPAVRHQAARFYTTTGVAIFLHDPVFTDSGRDYSLQNRVLGVAESHWGKASQLMPGNRDVAFYLALAAARQDPDHPDQVEALMAPMSDHLADRTLLADVDLLLGDAYFRAGRFVEARRRYAAACDAFMFPKIINTMALKRLGGL